MDKTFQNQQLVGTEYIKDSYTKINENFTEIDTDMDSFSDELTQIINETDLDPNKDPEVTNARTSTLWGTFATLQERLEFVEHLHPLEYFKIKMNPGLFDFSATNLVGRKWTFADGTTSTDERPTRTLTEAQTVILEGYFYDSPLCRINDNSTNSAYIGSLSDLPNNIHWLFLDSTQVSGDVKNLQNSVYSKLSIGKCPNIVADLSNLPTVTDFLSLNANPQFTGILPIRAVAHEIYLQGVTGIASTDIDASIANIVASLKTNGTLFINLGTTRTSASSADVATLQSRGWTVTDATIV